MKTALVTFSNLDGVDLNGDPYFDRYVKWLRYYKLLQFELEYDRIVLLDNCSNLKSLSKIAYSDLVLLDNYSNLCPPVSLGIVDIIRYEEKLGRGPNGLLDYPYNWRGLWGFSDVMKNYSKIIFIDSDGFVLSQRLAAWIRELKSGWSALYCPLHDFADGACQVLCEDAFDHFREYTKGDWREKNGILMERDVPYTHVERGFNADRFGEYKKVQTDEDYWGQARLHHELRYVGER